MYAILSFARINKIADPIFLRRKSIERTTNNLSRLNGIGPKRVRLTPGQRCTSCDMPIEFKGSYCFIYTIIHYMKKYFALCVTS